MYKKSLKIEETDKSYMWRELYGEPVYRFQTNDPSINKRMRQRGDFHLVGWGVNCKLWIYISSFFRPSEALRTFRRITRSKVKKDSLGGVFYAKTTAIVAQKSIDEM